MAERDDHEDGSRSSDDDAAPPAHNAKLAGYGYLIFLGVVLTGLSVWFVLTRTA